MPAIPHITNPSNNIHGLSPGNRWAQVCSGDVDTVWAAFEQARPTTSMDQQQDIERGVRRFIDDNFPLGDSGSELDRTDSLLEVGVIDSVGVLELIEFLEASYSIQIPDEDVLPENLDSLEAIGRYVSSRLSAESSLSDAAS
jgi:acyl carrier protein